MMALKEKTGKKGNWFGSPTPGLYEFYFKRGVCLKGYDFKVLISSIYRRTVGLKYKNYPWILFVALISETFDLFRVSINRRPWALYRTISWSSSISLLPVVIFSFPLYYSLNRCLPSIENITCSVFAPASRLIG